MKRRLKRASLFSFQALQSCLVALTDRGALYKCYVSAKKVKDCLGENEKNVTFAETPKTVFLDPSPNV
jgi:hypothetical protein